MTARIDRAPRIDVEVAGGAIQAVFSMQHRSPFTLTSQVDRGELSFQMREYCKWNRKFSIEHVILSRFRKA